MLALVAHACSVCVRRLMVGEPLQQQMPLWMPRLPPLGQQMALVAILAAYTLSRWHFLRRNLPFVATKAVFEATAACVFSPRSGRGHKVT